MLWARHSRASSIIGGEHVGEVDWGAPSVVDLLANLGVSSSAADGAVGISPSSNSEVLLSFSSVMIYVLYEASRRKNRDPLDDQQLSLVCAIVTFLPDTALPSATATSHIDVASSHFQLPTHSRI